jgi:hypothetical protein
MDKTTQEVPTLHAGHGSLDEAWQAFLDRAAGPGDRYDQIRALGGMAKARERWRREMTAS